MGTHENAIPVIEADEEAGTALARAYFTVRVRVDLVGDVSRHLRRQR
jgi:hypothetical protein